MNSQPDSPQSEPAGNPLVQHLIAGAILVAGAVLFSTKAIMVKLAMRYDVDAITLLLIRLVFALPFFVAVLVWTKVVRKRTERLEHSARSSASDSTAGTERLGRLRDHLPQIFLLGFIGYYLASYFDFVGLSYITASLERVILYSYPTIVLLITAIVFKKKISIHQVIAVALCYAGIFVAVWFGQSGEQNEDILLGSCLIFLSAVTYAIYLVGSGQLIPQLGVWVFTSAAMIVSALCVTAHFVIARPPVGLFDHAWQVYAYGLAMAFFATVIPSFLISEGIKRIGASNAAIIGGVGPVSTIILASIFLGEQFTTPQMIGTVMVIAGVIYISVNMKTE